MPVLLALRSLAVLVLTPGTVVVFDCPSREFVHGLLVGIANSVWVTGSHLLFSSSTSPIILRQRR